MIFQRIVYKDYNFFRTFLSQAATPSKLAHVLCMSTALAVMGLVNPLEGRS